MASFPEFNHSSNAQRHRYGTESKQARSGERTRRPECSGSRNSATANESGRTTCHQGCASRAQSTRGYRRQIHSSDNINAVSSGCDQPRTATRTSRREIRYAARRVRSRRCQREVEGTSSGEFNRLETNSTTEHYYPEAAGAAETAKAPNACDSTATETRDIAITETGDTTELRITKTSRPVKGRGIACTIIIS